MFLVLSSQRWHNMAAMVAAIGLTLVAAV